ncbi:LysR substrate-binding domain-containing protein [Comamonas composti]|uniref:LysR substrate-binding domain-containing protein n=1 Tax=Comamonas composti TaxID=408558 RepID=UPI000479314D|nr:LysR substrate-binding domain-containing protein [Comamonas composti]
MRRALPSTQALACFESAARHVSYTKAAQELSLTQSAVSRQIIALEEFLGVPLFKRTRHGVLLTEAGAQYAQQVSRWLHGLERDTLDMMARQGEGGTLSLAAVPTFATRWLLPRLPELTRENPDITVHIDVQTRPFLFADTVFDAALYAGTREQVARWPGVQTRWLMDEEVVPVCSPQLLATAQSREPGRAWLPVGPEVLARMPLLQQSTRAHGWQQWFDAMGVNAPRALDGMRLELFSMLAVAASQGLGVALMPPMLIEAELARGDLIIACAQPLRGNRAYYLVTPELAAEAQPAPALRIFSQWLQRKAAQARGERPA